MVHYPSIWTEIQTVTGETPDALTATMTSHLRLGTCFAQSNTLAKLAREKRGRSFQELVSSLSGREEADTVICFQVGEMLRGSLAPRGDLQGIYRRVVNFIFSNGIFDPHASTETKPDIWEDITVVTFKDGSWTAGEIVASPSEHLISTLRDTTDEGIYFLNVDHSGEDTYTGHSMTIQMKEGEYAFYDTDRIGAYSFKTKDEMLTALKTHLLISPTVRTFQRRGEGTSFNLQKLKIPASG